MRRAQAVGEGRIDFAQEVDEGRIETGQGVAIVEIPEGETEAQGGWRGWHAAGFLNQKHEIIAERGRTLKKVLVLCSDRLRRPVRAGR